MDPSELFLFQGLSHEEVSYFLLMSETEYVKAGKTIIEQ
jgi:hypothetical protein